MRTLHTITEKEVKDLLSLNGFHFTYIIVRKNNKEEVEFIKKNNFWLSEELVGNKYVIFKTFDLFDNETITIPTIVTVQGKQELSYVVVALSMGEVIDMQGRPYINVIKTIEWFLKSGFEVGNLTLKNNKK